MSFTSRQPAAPTQLLAATNKRKQVTVSTAALQLRGHAAVPSRTSLSSSSSLCTAQHTASGATNAGATSADSSHGSAVRIGIPSSTLQSPAPRLSSSSTASAASLPRSPPRPILHVDASVPAAAFTVTPTPASAPKSTIASYIHRFRTAPPLAPDERQRRLQQHHLSPEKDFWWLRKEKDEEQQTADSTAHQRQQQQESETGKQAEERRERESPAAAANGSKQPPAASSSPSSPTRVRLSLLPAIERLLSEDEKRISQQLADWKEQQRSSSTHPAPLSPPQPRPAAAAPLAVSNLPVASPTIASPTPSSAPGIPSLSPPALSAAAEPATLQPPVSSSAFSSFLPSHLHHENILRLARELHLPGLSSLALQPSLPSVPPATESFPYSPSRSFYHHTSAASFQPTPALQPAGMLLSSRPPPPPAPAPAPAAALRSSFFSSSTVSDGNGDDVDVDDLLAQWRRSRGSPAAAAADRLLREDNTSSSTRSSGSVRPLQLTEQSVDDVVEAVMRRIRTAEDAKERGKDDRPHSAAPTGVQQLQDEKAQAEPLAPPALASHPQPAVSPAVPSATQTEEKEAEAEAPTAHSARAADSRPAGSLRTRRRQLSLQLPPLHPRPVVPSDSSLPALRAVPRLVRPADTRWVQQPAAASTAPHLLQPAPPAVRVSPPLMHATVLPASAAVTALPSAAASVTSAREVAGGQLRLEDLEDDRADGKEEAGGNATNAELLRDDSALASSVSSALPAMPATMSPPLFFLPAPPAVPATSHRATVPAAAASFLSASHPPPAASLHAASSHVDAAAAHAASSSPSQKSAAIPTPPSAFSTQSTPGLLLQPQPFPAMLPSAQPLSSSSPHQHPVQYHPHFSQMLPPPYPYPIVPIPYYVPVFLSAPPALAAAAAAASAPLPPSPTPASSPAAPAAAAAVPAGDVSGASGQPPSAAAAALPAVAALPPSPAASAQPAPAPSLLLSAEEAEEQLAELLAASSVSPSVFAADPALQSLLLRMQRRRSRASGANGQQLPQQSQSSSNTAPLPYSS